MNDNESDRAVGRRPMAFGVRAFVKENDHEEEVVVSMQQIVRVRRAKSDRSRRCDIMPAVK